MKEGVLTQVLNEIEGDIQTVSQKIRNLKSFYEILSGNSVPIEIELSGKYEQLVFLNKYRVLIKNMERCS